MEDPNLGQRETKERTSTSELESIFSPVLICTEYSACCRRFLNNTVLSTVFNNSKDKKLRGKLTREDKALFKAAEKLKSKEVVDVKEKEVKKVPAAPVRKGKVALSSGSRLQAYLKAKELKESAEKKREEKEKEEEAKVATSVNTKPQPYWRPVQEDSE